MLLVLRACALRGVVVRVDVGDSTRLRGVGDEKSVPGSRADAAEGGFDSRRLLVAELIRLALSLLAIPDGLALVAAPPGDWLGCERGEEGDAVEKGDPPVLSERRLR